MKRYIVKRKADGLFMDRNRRWTQEWEDAKLYTQSGHIRNALRSPTLRMGNYMTATGKWPIFDSKRWAADHRKWLDERYEIIELTVIWP